MSMWRSSFGLCNHLQCFQCKTSSRETGGRLQFMSEFGIIQLFQLALWHWWIDWLLNIDNKGKYIQEQYVLQPVLLRCMILLIAYTSSLWCTCRGHRIGCRQEPHGSVAPRCQGFKIQKTDVARRRPWRDRPPSGGTFRGNWTWANTSCLTAPVFYKGSQNKHVHCPWLLTFVLNLFVLQR